MAAKPLTKQEIREIVDADPKKLEQIFSTLSTENLEYLIAYLKEKQNAIRSQEEELKNKENEAKLQPFEAAYQKALDLKIQLVDAFDEAAKELEKKREIRLGIANAQLQKALEELNEQRSKLGLKERRKIHLGPTVHWHVEVHKTESIETSFVEIAIKDSDGSPKQDTLTKINFIGPGKVNEQEIIDKIITPHGVIDPGGGKLRGLVGRIKHSFFVVNKEQSSENPQGNASAPKS